MLALKQMITPLTHPTTAPSASMFDGENVALHSSGSAPTMHGATIDGENVALHSSGSSPNNEQCYQIRRINWPVFIWVVSPTHGRFFGRPLDPDWKVTLCSLHRVR